ncbi:MAG: 4-hydroxybutyrate--acetyl-CoA CoA transferase [Firmicutes bacterium]|nr:4-hydroxybutyrate--acetyl-CoA CoA transferase [Bacillota bacterium]
MGSYSNQYMEKKLAPHDVVALIEDNAKIFVTCEPVTLLKELKEQRARFHNLFLFAMMGMRSKVAQDLVLAPEWEGHLTCGSCFLGEAEVRDYKYGKVEHISAHFSQFEGIVANHIKPGYLLANVSPMDDEGYFSLGYAPNGRVAVDIGTKVLLQVNENMPYIYSDYYKVHISEVTALCESNTPLMEFFDPEPSEIDRMIAGHIVERIPNGATIQLGIGGLPVALGTFLLDHKDLGIHTEMFSNTMTMLMKRGVVNNSKKKLCPGISVAAFVQGSKETTDFVHRNKNVQSKKLAWVNNPAIIAQNNDMISINACLSVDLRGQVCSESLGFNTSGGSGGQLDFVKGARSAPGGKSFIAMHSVAEKKDGTRISKIALTHPPGSVITTPRNDVHYLATEYGIAEMANRTARERTLALIAIAHPDFREQLTYEAKQHHLL